MRWPSEWSGFELVLRGQNGILLLDSVPWLLGSSFIEDGLGEHSEVGVGWDELLVSGVLPYVGLAKHEDVVSLSERIREEGDWFHNNFRVFGGGLVAGRSIEIPLW